MQVNTLSGQQAIINSKIYSAPGNERALRDITRQQETTESLYLYLLQKREEAQIAVASTSPKSKIIDYAYNASEFPVAPKRRIVYLASLIIGLLVPFSFIYAKDLLDNKVHNMHTLEKISKDTPVLGEIPKLGKNEEKMVIKEDRSILAEALRILRTNLDYLIKTKHKPGKNNVVYVTSSVPGEGKTFLSTNLSMILASTQKRVLLLGADIRNPKLYTFFMGSQIDKLSKLSKNKDAGLTEYLYDEKLEVEDIVNPMLVHHNTIDVIYSGRIPPNPAELLMSDRLKELIKEVSEMYDYVIVDTAPLMVVTDTLLISDYADHIIYVTRAGITEKKAVEFPIKLRDEGKIKGLSFVVNDVKASNLGYGGKYGYGYGRRQKKWWKF
jgi:capsular exopolysaccharide synthesis family protein